MKDFISADTLERLDSSRRDRSIRAVSKRKYPKMQWTPEMDEKLMRLFKRGVDIRDISTAMGCSPHSAYTRIWRIRRRGGVLPPRTQSWTKEQFEEALALYRSGMRLSRVADKIGRTFESVKYKLKNSRDGFLRVVTDGRVDIPEEVIADHNQRCAVRHSSLTASIFGDPLPGYSALDRRAQKEAA